MRTSRLLRDLLSRNPGIERFSVRHIIDTIGQGGAGAALMLFSIPSIVPVPGTSNLVGAPAMSVAGNLIAGRTNVRLPQVILERSVPRRALALAIHAVLPVLERAERMTRERWQWLCTPTAQRVIGVLVFLLALPLAFPILGFGVPHATALFTISLGMIEKDGVTIALGVTAGIASLVFLTGKSLSPKALAAKAADWIKGVVLSMTSLGKASAMLLKRAFRWLSAELLGRPRRGEKRTTKASPAAIAHRPAMGVPLTATSDATSLVAV